MASSRVRKKVNACGGFVSVGSQSCPLVPASFDRAADYSNQALLHATDLTVSRKQHFSSLAGE